MKTSLLKKSMIKVQALVLCFVLVLTLMPLHLVIASDANDQTANPDIVRTMNLSYKLKSGTTFVNLTAPYIIEDITKIDAFRASVSFELRDIFDDVTGEVSRSVTAGDYYLIDLPENLIISNPSSCDIMGNHNRPIASCSPELDPLTNQWKIKITFTDYVDDPNEEDIHGSMQFDFTLDLDAIGEGTSTTIYIPIDNTTGITIGVTNPEPPSTQPVSLTKTVASYNEVTRDLVWNIKIMPAIGIFSGSTFTDTIDISSLDLKSIKHGSVTLVEGVDYTYNSVTGDIQYIIANGRDGVDFQNIIITTTVKRSVYGRDIATTIANQAKLTGGDSSFEIDSNESTHTVTPEWFGKSGTLLEGNQIKWTLKANSSRQDMYNAVITDYLQADLKLDKTTVKLGTTSVTVHEGPYTPTDDAEVYAIYTENPDGTAILKIYLPRGSANASNSVQTVTFITDIVSPDTPVETNTVYNNTASLDTNYIGDGDGVGTLPTVDLGVVGVAVPHLSLTKGHLPISADDKRNGTITWTISAISNLSDYGKSTIVDTLPADQDYIAGEIYWGTQNINASTEPTAVISDAGRTLTITFNTPNALKTKQTFTVKTKIDPDVYGQNLSSRTFTNAVRGALFSETNINEELVSANDTDSVKISNTVISKGSSLYNGNETKQGINPRVNFTITINGNLMPLTNVVITDDLSNIITEFKKTNESTWNTVSGAKWTYLPGTLSVVKSSGTLDTLDLAAIVSGATYVGDVLTIDFGSGVQVNDKYIISFTAELDISQDEIFKENGTIRSKGNVAEIKADGLKAGIVGSPATGNQEVKNQVLNKTGIPKVEDQQIVWIIRLNQHRIELDNARVVDRLPLGLTLDPTSIKLYTDVIGGDGDFIADSLVETLGTPVEFEYTYLPDTEPGHEGRYVLTVDLPDLQTDYILRFATDVDKSLLGKTISNTAYYGGESVDPSNTDTSTMDVFSTSGGGSTRKTSLTVTKKDKDTGANLDTATFALHWLRNGEPVLVRTLTTSGGSVIFWGLSREEIYTITEVSAPNGYLLDNPVPVEFTTPAVGAGNAAPITFFNTPVKTGEWVPTAIKKLDGKSINRTFDFEINDGTTILLNGTTQTELANGDYTVAFSLSSGVNAEDILTFTDDHIFADTDQSGTQHLVDTKTFYMKEIQSVSPGYGFDPTEHTLLVKVFNVKGREDLKIVIEDGDGNVLTDDSNNFLPRSIPVFSNTYRANGSIGLSAEKTVIGHSLAADQFTFSLYEGTTHLQTVGNSAGALVAADTYTGNVNFDVINYTQSDVGIKTYRILENNTSLPGYNYDLAEYTVTVKIDDNDDGTLTSSIQSIQKNVGNVNTTVNQIDFTNTYTTTDVDVNLTASKTLDGRAILDNQFTFKLNQVTSSGAFIDEIGTVKNIGGNVALPKLTFNQSDIESSYYYQVIEVNEGQQGYTYDSTVYTVQVDIVDNDNGTISANQTITRSGDPVTSIAFENLYRASGSTVISAQKTLVGKALPTGQFGFTLQQFDLNSGADIGDTTVVRNAANGDVIFPEFAYTQDDVGQSYYYKVSEIDEAVGGYTYDHTVYTVQITVADNGDGTLDVQQLITEPTGETSITFENIYTVSDTSTTLETRKVLQGRVLENEQFTFVLNRVTETGEFVSEVQTLKNNAEGIVSFEDLVYTQADMDKTFHYTISEIQGASPGYTFDPTVYTVEINVIDNNDGTLTVDKTILKGTDSVLSALFTNVYTTTDTTIQLAAEKLLTGRELEDGQFKYLLILKSEDTQPLTLVEEVTNKADGSILFSTITYTQADMGKTFNYLVKEVDAANAGYTYDDTVYTVTVKVIDNGDGTLSTQVSTTKPGDENQDLPVESLAFTNVYTTTDTNIQLTANKTLTGRVLEDGQFKYLLTLIGDDTQSDTLVEEVTNKTDGSILFAPITYTQSDMGKTFIYSVTEVDDAKSGYAYDDTVYTVTVTVIDNGDGTLSTVVNNIIPGDEGQVLPIESLDFSNIYTASGSVTLAAKKMLVGQKLSNKQFSFVLTDKSGNILQTAYNDANGDILFDEIFFNNENLGEYQYKVFEVIEDVEGITYDKTVYLITVTVTDNGDGTLSAEVLVNIEGTDEKVEAAKISFANEYQAPATTDNEKPGDQLGDSSDNPSTGDQLFVAMYSFFALLSLLVMVITKSKKIKEN